VATVEIDKVSKAYGAVEVMRGVSARIENGQFTILVGPSGCGKSTLLRMIAGLETITDGEIRIDGEVVNDVAPKDRDIAMVFQNYALYPHMNVADNMAFSLKMRDVPRPEIDRRVREVAGILDLSGLLDRYPRQLSGGQRQRVAMGRAIVRDPQVFLFDEPLSNLDAKLRVHMRAEIKELHQRMKATVVYVTHDQIEAMTMADKIIVMQDGRVEQAGAPLELYDQPRNTFVAGFIGSPAMNFLEGEIDLGSGRFVSGGGLRLPLPPVSSEWDGARAIYGVRPEHFRIDEENGLEAETVVVEPTGSETLVMARLGDHEVACLFRSRIAARAGQTIRISPVAELTHLFDARTTARISVNSFEIRDKHL